MVGEGGCSNLELVIINDPFSFVCYLDILDYYNPLPLVPCPRITSLLGQELGCCTLSVSFFFLHHTLVNSSTIASTTPSYHPLNKAPAYNLLFLICLQLYNYCHHSEGEDYHMFLIWFSWAFLCPCLSTLLHNLTIETNHSSLHQLDKLNWRF